MSGDTDSPQKYRINRGLHHTRFNKIKNQSPRTQSPVDPHTDVGLVSRKCQIYSPRGSNSDP